MANEGSTKPTYSELEAELLRVRGLLQRRNVLCRHYWEDRHRCGLVLGHEGAHQCDYQNWQNGEHCQATTSTDVEADDYVQKS